MVTPRSVSGNASGFFPPLRTAALLVLVCGVVADLVRADGAAVFRAGAATADISPWLGLSLNGGFRDREATYVHDPLRARALVLDDGATRIAIVLCDSCMIPRDVVDAARERAAARLALEPSHLLVAATHAHSCPAATPVFQSDPDPDYQRFLAVRIADAVSDAVERLEPAQVAWGAASVPQHVFNRRWRMAPGSIPPDPFGRRTDEVRMNPPRESPDLIEPAGPTDPEVAFVAVAGLDGRPRALLANYSLHYVGGTGGGHVSADYFGLFAERIEELLGVERVEPPFVGILSNGTSGDINNIDFRKKREAREPYEQMRLVADDVAREVRRAYDGLAWRSQARLGAWQTSVALGVRRPGVEDLARAREVLARAGSGALRSAEEVYARETVLLAEYPERVDAILQVLRIGDLAIAAIPCEVFVEIGLELKETSPFPSTFTIELANGYNGYLPTVEQHALGGYETWRARSSYLEVGAAPRIVREIRSLLAAAHAGE